MSNRLFNLKKSILKRRHTHSLPQRAFYDRSTSTTTRAENPAYALPVLRRRRQFQSDDCTWASPLVHVRSVWPSGLADESVIQMYLCEVRPKHGVVMSHPLSDIILPMWGAIDYRGENRSSRNTSTVSLVRKIGFRATTSHRLTNVPDTRYGR